MYFIFEKYTNILFSRRFVFEIGYGVTGNVVVTLTSQKQYNDGYWYKVRYSIENIYLGLQVRPSLRRSIDYFVLFGIISELSFSDISCFLYV